MSKPVWIIDDDRSIRWVLEKALAREAIEYKSFASADEALAELPVPLREVVVLHYIEALPRKAVSEILDLPETTLRERLSSALEKLQGLLKLRGESLRRGYVLLAGSYEKTGRPEKALSFYQVGARLFPRDPQLLSRLQPRLPRH